MSVLIAAFMVIPSPALAQKPEREAHGKADESLKKADDLYKAGKFKEAIEAYKEVLSADPSR